MREKWEYCRLDQLGNGHRPVLKAGPFGSSITKSKYSNGGYKVYGQQEVVSGNPFSGSYYIDDQLYRELESCNVQPGDLLITLMGTVGRVLLIPTGAEPGIINPRLMRVSLDKERAEPEFIAHVLMSPPMQRLLERRAQGGTMPGLNSEALASIELPLPPMTEQRKITEILQAWDKAIEKCDQLINGKEKLRHQLKNELISWMRWPKIRIGDVVVAVTRPVPTPKSAYNALSIRSHGKGTFHRRIERPEEIDMDTVYEVGPRDLIVNITFAWEGAIALAKPEDAGFYVSHRFPTFEVNENVINREFLGYAVCTRRFIHFLGIASPGGAGRNRVLNKNDFLDLEIPFPPKGEQDRAASILLSADREISLLQAMRDALAKQKRGLMHKLLAGEWRLPADAEVAA